MLTCSIDYWHQARKLLYNSGRGPFHFGRYYDCIQNPKMRYSLIHAGINGAYTGIYTGLCLPQQCKDQEVAKYLNSTLKIFSKSFSIYSINSQNYNYLAPLNWVSYVTAAILVLLSVLVLVATVKFYKIKREGPVRLLKSFDAVTNIREHFKVRQNQDLNLWDGVRAIAMMWVVIGHSFSTPTGIGFVNYQSIFDIAKQPFVLLLQAGEVSVDIFFALGGFFLAFVMLRYPIKAKTCGLGVLQRIIRICPAYFLSMMFLYSLFLRLGSGAIWREADKLTKGCKTMWKQMLFVGNFVENGTQPCLGWGWYLQVDFQLFLLGILLMYTYSKKRQIFMKVTVFLAVASTIYIYVFTYVKENKIVGGKNGQDFLNDVYVKPYGRCVPYLMGLIFGVLYMEYRLQTRANTIQHKTFLSRLKLKVSRRRFYRIAIEWIGVSIMAFVSFITRPVQVGGQWPQAVHSLYMSFSKPLFIIGMFLCILPSSLGVRQSFFNLILNARILVYIARISFSTYLVHLLVIALFYGTRSYDTSYNLTDNFIVYLGLLLISLFFGFLVTVFIELPLSNLLKNALPNLKQKAKQSSPQTQSLITNESVVQSIHKQPE